MFFTFMRQFLLHNSWWRTKQKDINSHHCQGLQPCTTLPSPSTLSKERGQEHPPTPKSKVINPNTQQVDEGPQNWKLTTFLLSCYKTVLPCPGHPRPPPQVWSISYYQLFYFSEKNEHTEFIFPTTLCSMLSQKYWIYWGL